MKKNYSIGLDIGNTSVGWAVIGDDDQKIIKKGKGSNRKALWGVRLFESADTASERRNFRSTRRRYDRRRWRISLLKDIFAEEIQKVDKNFFQKLQETFYNEKDCLNKKIHITAEERIKIKEYNNHQEVNDLGFGDYTGGIENLATRKYRSEFLKDLETNSEYQDCAKMIKNNLD